MTSHRLIGLAVFAVALMTGAAASADGPAPLKLLPPLAKGVDSLPRLIGKPGNHAVARINLALARKDAEIPCRTSRKDRTSYARGVVVTMRGPRYLSVLTSENWFCGGPYPTDGENTALVYDLATGARADWKRLLPPELVQKLIDYNDVGEGLVVSAALTARYIPSSTDDAQCRSAIAHWSGGLGFMLWPDARADGIAIQPKNLPHVVAACGPEVVIGARELRKLGVAPSLLDAIDEAHRRGWYDKRASK